MGFFSFLYEIGKNASKGKNQQNNYDEHCESCGDFLEDCKCDWQDCSREDISFPHSPEDKN